MVQVFRSLRRMTKGLAGFDQQFVDSGIGVEAILVVIHLLPFIKTGGIGHFSFSAYFCFVMLRKDLGPDDTILSPSALNQ